jgi:hypothetical protein
LPRFIGSASGQIVLRSKEEKLSPSVNGSVGLIPKGLL